ncbi:MAG: hypothetical protein LBJ17_07265 [Dysgonamonadaceae bacterium]|jgi:hypothetical protein|nr:hypothetical protein [Dysgonamonadaceae bacterium]
MKLKRDSAFGKFNSANLAAYAVIAAGILVALLQFLNNHEMVQDEARVVFNIKDRSFAGLLRPLDYVQVAPILFLWITKALSFISPTSEQVYRVFPFVCFAATLFLFLKFLNHYVKDKYAVVIILAFYTFNNMVLFFATEQVKQYMGDVLVLFIIYYITAVRAFKTDRTRLLALGIAGTVFVFLSNVAPVILFTAGVYLFYEEFFVTGRRRILPYLPVFAAWLGSFAVYYFNFIADHPTYEFMADFWDYSFMPYHSLGATFHFLVERSEWTLSFFFPYSTPYLLKILFPAVGFAVLVYRRNFRLLILVLVPIMLHLILSAFRLYPVDVRMMLYLFPGIALLIGTGVYEISRFVLSFVKPVYFRVFALSVPVVLMVYYIGFLRPHQKQREVKETMEYVNANIQEGEKIYLHWFVICNYLFYSDQGILDNMKKSQITDGQWTEFIAYKRGDLVQEFAGLKGRTWFLISGDSDEKIMTDHLESLGHTRLKEFHFSEGDWEGRAVSAAYLYDCGE